MTTTDWRRGAADARRGIMELALDLADGDDDFRFFGLGGGLHRRRCVVHAIFDGNVSGESSGVLSWARRLIAGCRDPPGDGIA